MRSFEIFVAPGLRAKGPSPELSSQGLSYDPATATTEFDSPSSDSARSASLPSREVLDVFIGGANVMAFANSGNSRSSGNRASLERTNAGVAGALRDLVTQVAQLASRARGKAIVRLYDDPWELCIERLHGCAALSVYRTGSDPVAVVHDRIVPFREVVASLRDAVADVIRRAAAPAPLLIELSVAEQALSSASVDEPDTTTVPVATPVTVEIDTQSPVSFAAEFAMRPGPPPDLDAAIERTDVHALLFRGRLRAEVRGHAVDLGEGHPFLLAERLLLLVRQTLDAWERGAALHVRAQSGPVLVGIRLDTDGEVALTLGAPRRRGERGIYTFPALGVPDLALAAVAYGRALARAVLRRDRTQSQNLRLTAFRRQLREASDLLREACKDDALVNPSPESYRAFLAPAGPTPASTSAGVPAAGTLASAPIHRSPPAPARLRYALRWRAIVPGIDLRATFLCGDRLVVGAAAETFCLDRSSGEVLWRVPTQRATVVVTPGGVARLTPDGELCVHDFGTGEVTLRSWLVPRHGPPAGAVVNLPGLPRLLITTEGERHLVAIDLSSGEPRWRFACAKKGTLRLKRAGKLLYFTSGDSALVALDVLTGAVVWRARDRLRFRGAPALDHDAIFAVAGGVASRAHLLAVDAFSGRVLWKTPLSSDTENVTVEGPPVPAGAAVLCALRDRRGLKLVAASRESGRPLWTSPGYIAPSGTSWLAVDDLVVGNTPTGTLIAIEAATGKTRYRHELGVMLETDVPRRLEPVLRSGALFVPHADVHVLRPQDGGLIGTIGPCEAIPDLLRVDERCDVYVAEESGHLASFAAGPRLTLVK